MEKDPALPQLDMPLDVLILAAGLGTRMKSAKAKVLHELDGRALISHVCRTAERLEPRQILVVVGHQADEVERVVREQFTERRASFVIQAQQRGTGDAVSAARAELQHSHSTLLVLSGDVPMVKAETLEKFVTEHRASKAACSILSVRLENPFGYGRVVRDADNNFVEIIEQKDATDEQRQIREINAGIYCFETDQLFPALARVEPANEQGEYYLTDVPGILLSEGNRVNVYLHEDSREVAGVNTRAELAEFENLLRRSTIRRLLLDGVTFIDPSHTYISTEAEIGRDTVIYPNVSIEGHSVIGESCELRAGVRLTNSRLGNNVVVKDHSIIVNSDVESNCSVGPFAHLRMASRMIEGAVVGNFVELKKSELGRSSKANHLTYLGDATIGERTNIGAGTITCNYDGKNKHPTIIEDRVKIGSDTMLVAPVRVGSGSVTAAGSVVTKDVPPETLVAGVPAVVKKRLSERKDGPEN
jgi:bifunctional UDP-N-acetylglucosamine pyrophosphorylase / glucosamine-1-phosphate N-acetyltransferase